MNAIRRLYYYAVALVSLEVVLWGMIGLARSVLHSISSGTVGSLNETLARSLALILVGVPVFIFHWIKAQRDAGQDTEERASGVRAAFIHLTLLATLIPVVQNILALVNRTLLDTAQMNSRLAIIGGAQSWTDNLVAAVMNLLVAGYFLRVARGERESLENKSNFILVRRSYRIIWHIYGLVLVIAGMQQTLRFVLDLIPGPFGSMMRAGLVNGVSLLILGTPIWVFAWRTIQQAPGDAVERGSLERLGMLYFLSLAGVLTVLTAAGTVLDTLLRLVFGQSIILAEVINRINLPLAIGIPLGIVWAYYGHWLGRTIAETADTTRRAGMRRIFTSILALIGLVAAFSGMSMVMFFIVDRLILGTANLGTLTAGLAALACGLPLWLLTWRPLQAEALAAGDAGDHARRSLLRRSYLYLVLFASVVGGMISAGGMFFELLRSLLDPPQTGTADRVLRLGSTLLLFAGLGVYHGLTLRRNGKLALATLEAKHAGFPVLIFDPGDGQFAASMQAAIHRQAPAMPVSVHPAAQSVGSDNPPRAVVLPAGLALEPPEPLRQWLIAYQGRKLAVPGPAGDWIVSGSAASETHQAALTLRSLAEGQELRLRGGNSGWMVVVYIAAAFFGLEMLFTLISLGLSFFMD